MCSSDLGAGLNNVELRHAQIADGRWNGGQAKDVTVANSEILATTLNGGRLWGFQISDASRLMDVKLNGASLRRVSMIRTQLSDVVLGGQDFRDAVFEDVVWTDVVMEQQGQQGAWRVENLTARNFRASDVLFENCRFGDTLFADCDISNLHFVDVDFRAMELTRAEQFAGLAEEGDD